MSAHATAIGIFHTGGLVAAEGRIVLRQDEPLLSSTTHEVERIGFRTSGVMVVQVVIKGSPPREGRGIRRPLRGRGQ